MAVDYYLKLDGIQGEATDQDFKDQINLLSFSWGGSQVSSRYPNGGSGAGKVELSDFSIMKHYDKSSPQLFKALVSGTHIETAVLSAVKAGGERQGVPQGHFRGTVCNLASGFRVETRFRPRASPSATSKSRSNTARRTRRGHLRLRRRIRTTSGPIRFPRNQ